MDHTLWLAYCITDGEFENMNEIQKSIILHVVENMLNEHTPPKATKKTPKKYQNNEGCQNKAKVSK